MEERIISSNQTCCLLASATEDEIAVSEILLSLKTMMSLSESLWNWRGRRRRTGLPAPSSHPPTSKGTGIEIKEVVLQMDAADEKSGGAPNSPTTPLYACFSETDGKSKRSKASKKRPMEKYLSNIQGLNPSGDMLPGDARNVKNLNNNSKSLSKALKPKKTKKISTKEDSVVAMGGRLTLGADPTRDYMVSMAPRQHTYIPNPMGQMELHGVTGIDLNLPATAEALGLDTPQLLDSNATNRAGFAEARRKRMAIMRAKSMKRRRTGGAP